MLTEPMRTARSTLSTASHSAASAPRRSDSTDSHSCVCSARRLALRARGGGDALVQRDDPLVAASGLLDLAREHHGGCRRAADHGRVRALEGDSFELVVRALR